MVRRKTKKTKSLRSNRKILGLPIRAVLFILLFANVGMAFLYFTSAASYDRNDERWLVSKTNKHRYEHKRAPSVSEAKCLQAAARAWSKYLGDNNKWQHSDTGSLITKYCGTWGSGAGEILGRTTAASNQNDVSRIFGTGDVISGCYKNWMCSSGHHSIIDGSSYDFVGYGAYVNSKGVLYVTGLFVNCNSCSGSNWQSPDTNTLPKGNLDSNTNSASINFTCRKMYGWAYDPDSSSKSISIHIYIDGSGKAITANRARADVNKAFNISGDHGFQYFVPIKYHDNRQHTFTAYAIDAQDSSKNTMIGSRTLTCPQPIGNIDNLTCRSIRGWAADPSNTKRNVELHIYFANPDGSGKKGYPGIYTNIKRSDVNTHLKNLGYYYNSNGTHGFDYSVPTEWRSKHHRTWVYAINGSTQPQLIYNSYCY